jgi:hypothetical protein
VQGEQLEGPRGVILTTAGLLASYEYWCSHQSVSECTACSSDRRIAPPQIGVIVTVPRGWVLSSQRTQGLDSNLSFTPAKFQVEPSTQHHALARAVSARYWRPPHTHRQRKSGMDARSNTITPFCSDLGPLFAAWVILTNFSLGECGVW